MWKYLVALAVGLGLLACVGAATAVRNAPPLRNDDAPRRANHDNAARRLAGNSPEAAKAETRELALTDALESGLVSGDFHGDGLSRMHVSLHSNAQRPLRLTVPLGLLLEPRTSPGNRDNSLYKTMLTTAPACWTMAPGGTLHTTLAVACASAYLETPTQHTPYRLGRSCEIADLNRLLESGLMNDIPFGLKQMAVWTLTDDPRRDDFPEIRRVRRRGSRGFSTEIALTTMNETTASELAALFDAVGIPTECYYAFFAFPGDSYVCPIHEHMAPLRRRLAYAGNPVVRAHALAEIACRMWGARDPKYVELLISLVNDRGQLSRGTKISKGFGTKTLSYKDSRELTVGFLAAEQLAKQRAWRTLLGLTKLDDPVVRYNAVAALEEAFPEVRGRVGPMLDDPDPGVRARAVRTYASGLSARAVGSANDQEAFAFRRVIHALDDPIAEVREAATEMLYKRHAYDSPLLMAWANERLTRVALHDQFRAAFKTLGAAGNNAAIPALKQLGRHDNALVRGRATDALYAIGTPEATLALEEISAWEQEYYKRQINENRR